MKKTILAAIAFLSFGFAQAQDPPQFGTAQQVEMLRPQIQAADALPRMAAMAPIHAQSRQVINLGDIVLNVVIAKVLRIGDEAELTITKFRGKETNAQTTYRTETKTRQMIVNGQVKKQTYSVQIPVTSQVQTKENFTPTEQDPSIPVASIQAFDLKGNPLETDKWTKQLETPKHVLLIREPINETNRLNPFYAATLREDTLLLFLNGKQSDNEQQDEVFFTKAYNVQDLPVWSKDGEDLDPTVFIDLLKSKVAPNEWARSRASLVPTAPNRSLVITANAKTHDELTFFFKDLRIKGGQEARSK